MVRRLSGAKLVLKEFEVGRDSHGDAISFLLVAGRRRSDVVQTTAGASQVRSGAVFCRSDSCLPRLSSAHASLFYYATSRAC